MHTKNTLNSVGCLSSRIFLTSYILPFKFPAAAATTNCRMLVFLKFFFPVRKQTVESYDVRQGLVLTVSKHEYGQIINQPYETDTFKAAKLGSKFIVTSSWKEQHTLANWTGHQGLDSS